MRTAIVASGGITKKGVTAFDREIIRLSGKKHPKLLYLPTADSDNELYWKHVRDRFGGLLKCQTDVLFLIRQQPSRKEIREKILWADIVCVGGGNTLMMMRRWRHLGVDRLLKEAYRKGTVMCGVSAGAICWFESGHSDSMWYYDPHAWAYIKVKGLGLVPGTFCPHYNGSTGRVPRRKRFAEMIRKSGGFGIGVENDCAIEIIDGQYYKIVSGIRARAFKLYKIGSELTIEEIPRKNELTPLSNLYRQTPALRAIPRHQRPELKLRPYSPVPSGKNE